MPSRKPVSAISAMRPSIMTLVSRILNGVLGNLLAAEQSAQRRKVEHVALVGAHDQARRRSSTGEYRVAERAPCDGASSSRPEWRRRSPATSGRRPECRAPNRSPRRSAASDSPASDEFQKKRHRDPNASPARVAHSAANLKGLKKKPARAKSKMKKARTKNRSLSIQILVTQFGPGANPPQYNRYSYTVRQNPALSIAPEREYFREKKRRRHNHPRRRLRESGRRVLQRAGRRITAPLPTPRRTRCAASGPYGRAWASWRGGGHGPAAERRRWRWHWRRQLQHCSAPGGGLLPAPLVTGVLAAMTPFGLGG